MNVVEQEVAVKKKGLDMLLDFGADPNIVSPEGSTPLTQVLSCSMGLYEQRMKLRKTNPKTDQKLEDDGDNIVGSMVSRILSAGADPNLRRADSDTPLKWAISMGCVEGAKLLLSAGADVNATSRYSKSVVHELCNSTSM